MATRSLFLSQAKSSLRESVPFSSTPTSTISDNTTLASPRVSQSTLNSTACTTTACMQMLQPWFGKFFPIIQYLLICLQGRETVRCDILGDKVQEFKLSEHAVYQKRMLALVAHTRWTYPKQFYDFEVKLSRVLEDIRPVRGIPVPAQVTHGTGPNSTVYPAWELIHSHLWSANLRPE